MCWERVNELAWRRSVVVPTPAVFLRWPVLVFCLADYCVHVNKHRGEERGSRMGGAGIQK